MEGDVESFNLHRFPSLDFYPRPHLEGDPFYCPRRWPGHNFYPRPHMEGDSLPPARLHRHSYFYPRPLMEGDPAAEESTYQREISTHALSWRATFANQLGASDGLYFYPRPLMEGDLYLLTNRAQPHAISTHALSWRATRAPSTMYRERIISTHALSWRATRRTESRCFGGQNFYPRPLMEGDMSGKTRSSRKSEFLPTPSHGGRLAGRSKPNGGDSNFYPRPLMEGDTDGRTMAMTSAISTHALSWRATVKKLRVRDNNQISTHALSWRATYRCGDKFAKRLISTHALSWRAT